MCDCTRRTFIAAACSGSVGLALWPDRAGAQEAHARFIAEAQRMKAEAVAAGDQPFGAVVVRDGAIVGWGPSRVHSDRNLDAHAERVALRDAQRRLGADELPGAVVYSTSRPCAACETALASANIDRMYHGPSAVDAGRPGGR